MRKGKYEISLGNERNHLGKEQNSNFVMFFHNGFGIQNRFFSSSKICVPQHAKYIKKIDKMQNI